MSGFQKFKNTEEWREELKEFLLMERKPEPIPREPIQQTERYSLDFSEDFLTLLKEKKKKPILKENKEMSQVVEEDKENQNFNFADSPQPYTHKMRLENVSDESFEAIEKMCDKTASDPNSTLFMYLHSENKEQIVNRIKKLSTDDKICTLQSDFEKVECLQVFKSEFVDKNSPSKFGNETQLEDIEEPSRLWENTIANDTVFQTSPVKMVGLLRPSTIIEENAEESLCSNKSSQLSFQTALKETMSSAVSSNYETASESITGAKIETKDNLIEFNDSGDLIDLEKTFGPDLALEVAKAETVESQLNDETESDLEDFVIELLSDDDEDKKKDVTMIKSPNNSQSNQISLCSNVTKDFDSICSNETRTFDSMCSSKTLSFDSGCSNTSKNENRSYHKKKSSNEFEESREDKSLHFNDTLEEVEYMMKKGMEYMAATKPWNLPSDVKTCDAATNISIAHQQQNKENTFIASTETEGRSHGLTAQFMSDIKTKPPVLSPSKKQPRVGPGVSPKAKTPASNSKPRNMKDFAVNIKPMPKLDVFKKPTSGIPLSESMRKHKDITNKQFSHIVSPIGAYVKKTGITPLMMSNHLMADKASVHNSSAFRELEYESRGYQPRFEENLHKEGGENEGPNFANPPRSLPKKAYISSEFKHIVDERTPVTIPGGKSIQKYLETAMLPAVVRHDGKLKMPSNEAKNVDLRTKRNNDSLADLSVVSGDVSVYTIMDAQKF